MPERDNPSEGLPPAPYREPPIVQSSRLSFRLPRLLRRRHTPCCRHSIDQAFHDLEVSAADHRKRQMVGRNRKFIGQIEQLLDQLPAGQSSFAENDALDKAKQTLSEMRLLCANVRVEYSVEHAINAGIAGLAMLKDRKWDAPEMKPSAIAYLEAIRCQFSSHVF